MANILIKFCTALILFINLFSATVNADTKNLKQVFYIVSEDKKSEDLYADLNVFKDKEIPVFLVLDPNESIDKKTIEVLEDFQKETNLGIILEEDKNLENSHFAVKGYDKKLKISGVCNIQDDKLTYTGEVNTFFDVIDISEDPLKIISDINIQRENDSNYALVFNSNKLNISTLLLANNELKGMPLDTSDYRLSLKEPTLMDNIIIYVGYINSIIFSISIIIFIAAIIIFRNWSTERFLD